MRGKEYWIFWCLGSCLHVSLYPVFAPPSVAFLLITLKTVWTRQWAYSGIFVLTRSYPRVVGSPEQASLGRKRRTRVWWCLCEPCTGYEQHGLLDCMFVCLIWCWRLKPGHCTLGSKTTTLPPSHTSSFSEGFFFPNPGSCWKQPVEACIGYK